jgi:hypothetical protein
MRKGEYRMTSSVVKAMLSVMVAGTLAIGGPNKSAGLFIDLAPMSPGIDSMGSRAVDSNFVAGVAIHGANKLFDYQFFVVYDTAQLRFISAIKGNSDSPNFLESNGGAIFFAAKRSLDDSTRILIAGSLMGDDTAQCIDGSGILAFVTFKKRNSDTTSLFLKKPIVENCDLAADTECPTYGAKVFTGPISVLYTQKANKKQERMACFNGIVRMGIPSGARDCRASVFDVFGREIRKFTIRQQTMEADLSTAADGMYFITIAANNAMSSRPIFLKK